MHFRIGARGVYVFHDTRNRAPYRLICSSRLFFAHVGPIGCYYERRGMDPETVARAATEQLKRFHEHARI